MSGVPSFDTMSLDVETSSGVFRGVRRGNGAQWLGVPYAAAPVGPLRFQPPQPPTPRSGVRPADHHAPAALQPRSLAAPRRQVGDGTSEDCLYLNVHAPAAPGDGDPRPVLVWIHGGAFTNGSGALYDGAPLAELGDVLVVTVNYRLGVFGFCNLGTAVDAPVASNLGVRDQIAALEWVRDNIAAFGGDPARVTVAGESAGSICVALLLCAPKAEGLFRAAILQSGSYSLVHGPETTRVAAQAVADALGLRRGDGERLRTLSSGRLLEAQVEAAKHLPGTVPSAPWFDGDVVTASLAEAQATVRPQVPVLAGTNHDETELFRLLPGDILPTDRPTVAARLHAALGAEHAGRILAAYPDDRRGNRALTTDFDFGEPTRHLAERQVAAGGRAFVYRFDAGVPWWGATHAAELAYLWPMRGLNPIALRGPFPGAARASLAARLQWAWVRFVRDLDPGGGWPPYDQDRRAVQVFDVRGDHVEDDPESARRVAWAGADVMPKE